MLKSAFTTALGLLVTVGPARENLPRGHGGGFDAEDVLARSRAAYAALQSYADSGTLIDENAGYLDRSTFRTYFTRDPRNLFLEFRFLGSEYKNGYRLAGDRRTVIWMRRGELQTWYSETQAHETYPADGGRQVEAVTGASYRTAGLSVLISSLLYTNSGMTGPVHATEDAVADGEETIGGRRCFKVTGVERWRYPNGRITGVRPITLWIDAETYLIRKVLEDTPEGYPRGGIGRRIVTLDPQANPRLEDSEFHFRVPDRHR